MSGFDLTSDWTDGWQSYDSFFNNVVLGGPHASSCRILKIYTLKPLLIPRSRALTRTVNSG